MSTSSRARTPLRSAVVLLLVAFLLPACGGDDGGSGPSANRPPEIRNARDVVRSNLATLIPGDTITLEIEVLDPDVEPVTTSWSLEPATDTGVFSDPDSRSTTWTVGGQRGQVTVRCTVSDGKTSVDWTRTFTVATEIAAQTVTGTTTWSAAQSPSVITGAVEVAEEATLTVESGVELQLRPRFNGATGTYTRFGIRVLGRADFGSEGAADAVRIQGGLVENVLADQHLGLTYLGIGSGRLHRVRISDARTAVTHTGSGTVDLFENCLLQENTENGIRLAAVGGDMELQGVRIEDSAFGITFTSGQLTMTDTTFRSCNTAVNASASFTATGCLFEDSLNAHLALDTGVSIVTVNVDASNFSPPTEGGFSVAIAEDACTFLDLELRGNYWGGQYGSGEELLALFDRGEDCNAGVADWTDSDCGDGDCDWSNESL